MASALNPMSRKKKQVNKNIQQQEYDVVHLAPTVRAWAARRPTQGDLVMASGGFRRQFTHLNMLYPEGA
jgi:hypothetical protein